jgi:hypothetical protein
MSRRAKGRAFAAEVDPRAKPGARPPLSKDACDCPTNPEATASNARRLTANANFVFILNLLWLLAKAFWKRAFSS